MQATATAYLRENLVSDGAIAATFTDAKLVNPWGLVASPTGTFWVANSGTGTVQVFDASGRAQSTTVTIPAPTGATGPAAPTGEVFNTTSGFAVSANGETGPAQVLVATKQGTIAGFNSTVDATNAVTVVDNSATGAVYTGLAAGTVNGSPVIYATDFHNRRIDVFGADFSPVSLTGTFADPRIPKRFAPFGIADIDGQIYVSYARQNARARAVAPGVGRGFVDVFTPDGVLVQRLIRRGRLNAPWGMTIASANFGKFSNDLLVGNSGSGTINAFNPDTGRFVGTLRDSSNAPIRIGGLHGLSFGDSGAGDSLFITAGPGGGRHGLLGLIKATSVPETPSSTPTTAANQTTTAADQAILALPVVTPVDTGAVTPENTPLPPLNSVLTGSSSDVFTNNSNSGSLLA